MVLFLSANIANVANLLFNMVFARLMGPAAFADLTFLITLKLGALSILAAFQYSFSKFTAIAKTGKSARFAAIGLSRRSLLYSIPIMFIVLALAESFARLFNFADVKSLMILALVIPFFFPMIIFRGLAQGRIDIPRIVGSIQTEWIIRLFGGILLWQLGFGLSGIAFAVGLSLFAGMLFAMQRYDIKLSLSRHREKIPPTYLLAATVPFFALQCSQVLILDGDILLAKAMFPADKAGLAAGVMLVQRIFFFAFLSFSTLLLPIVSSKFKSNEGSGGRKEFKLMASSIIAVSGIALSALALMPSLVISIILGPEFASLSNMVIVAGLTGAAFTITHLCSVYLLALGDSKISWIVLLTALIQLFILFAFVKSNVDLNLISFFGAKLALQITLAVSMLAYALSRKSHDIKIK